MTTNVYYQTTKRHERTRTFNFDPVEEVSGVKASGWFAKLWTRPGEIPKIFENSPLKPLNGQPNLGQC